MTRADDSVVHLGAVGEGVPQPAAPRVVIVGAGPAGLAAAHLLIEAGRDVLVLEAGRGLEQRLRDDGSDVLSGVGGAGLYSDGKFSFFPAGTQLWELPNRTELERAYAWTSRMLNRAGLETPPFPSHPAEAVRGQVEGFKPYPSSYLDLKARYALITRLAEPLASRLWLGRRLLAMKRREKGVLLEVEQGSGRLELEADLLVGTGGRFFPLWAADQGFPMRFLRTEVGVRLEGPAEHPFFAHLVEAGQSIDPKLIFRGEAGLEWRTFCCCRNGEVVEGRWSKTWTALSGRADGEATGRSNVGFNVRFTRAETAPDLEALKQSVRFELKLEQVLAPGGGDSDLLDERLGPEVARALRQGLNRLADNLPSLLDSSGGGLCVLGPALEGVGAYPCLSEALQVEGWPVFVAGDAAGRFRGLVPALVSGAYVALQIMRNEGLAVGSTR